MLHSNIATFEGSFECRTSIYALLFRQDGFWPPLNQINVTQLSIMIVNFDYHMTIVRYSDDNIILSPSPNTHIQVYIHMYV